MATKHWSSTILRYKEVEKVYLSLLQELGEYANLVPRSYIYRILKERTGLSPRTISRIINHS